MISGRQRACRHHAEVTTFTDVRGFRDAVTLVLSRRWCQHWRRRESFHSARTLQLFSMRLRPDGAVATVNSSNVEQGAEQPGWRVLWIITWCFPSWTLPKAALTIENFIELSRWGMDDKVGCYAYLHTKKQGWRVKTCDFT